MIFVMNSLLLKHLSKIELLKKKYYSARDGQLFTSRKGVASEILNGGD